MNVTTAKKPQKRIDTLSFRNIGITGYGEKNLYPQELINIIQASETAVACRNRRTGFIEGNGFKDISFSETVLNSHGETADDLLRLVAEDVSNFYGMAIHVNYNMLGEAVSFSHVPFENCRLCEADDSGYIGKIAVHPDWTGKLRRNGKTIQVKAETIDYIDIYNPNPRIVLAQIEAAGGIGMYKGQILWVGKGKQTYPVPAHDAVVAYMSAEEGLGNVSNRNVRHGFNPAGFLFVKKGINPPNQNVEGYENSNTKPDINRSARPDAGVDDHIADIANTVERARTDEGSSSVVILEYEYDEDIPVFKEVRGTNYDKEFTVTVEKSEEKIYAAFNQDVFYRLRKGSVGFSSEMIQQAYEYYSSVTGGERRMIERAFNSLFKDRGINMSGDFTVEPVRYVSENKDAKTIPVEIINTLTVNEKRAMIGYDELADADSDKSLLAEKIGVGGTQAMKDIVSDQIMSDDTKRGMLKVLFSLTDEEIEIILPKTIAPQPTPQEGGQQ
jgi:hypothetical protein